VFVRVISWIVGSVKTLPENKKSDLCTTDSNIKRNVIGGSTAAQLSLLSVLNLRNRRNLRI